MGAPAGTRCYAEPNAYIVHGDRRLAVNRRRPAWGVVNGAAEWILRFCEHPEGRTPAEVRRAYSDALGPAPADEIDAALAALEDARLMRIEGAGHTEQPARDHACATYAVEHLYIELLARCNLRCIHCYMSGAPERPELLEAEEVVRLLRDFSDLGGQYVTLSGGEPLIYKPFERVAREVDALGLAATVITNGTRLREPQAALLAELGFQVAISLDGASPDTHERIRGHGTFARTLRGIDLAARELGGDRVTLSMTPNRVNLGDLPALFELARERGIRRLNLSLIEPAGRSRDHWDELALTQDEREAFVGTVYDAALAHVGEVEVDFNDTRNILDVFATDRQPGELHPLWRGVRVDSSGDCYPSTFGSAGDYHLGNVRAAPLADILGSPILTRLHAMLEDRFTRIPRCRSCAWGQLCRGGGITSAYYATGDLFEPDTYCGGYLKTFPRVAAAIADLPAAAG